jgi:RNA polymerase-binding transcription factor DksA
MLTGSQLAALEQRLLEERRTATRIVRELGREIESGAAEHAALRLRYAPDSDHDSQQESAGSIVQWHTERLSLIDDALNRLRETPDDFNVSVVSGLTIPYERLETTPWTRVLAEEAEPQRAPGSDIRDARSDIAQPVGIPHEESAGI